MFGVPNSIEHGVAEIHIGRAHIDLGPKHMRTIGVLSRPHIAKELKVFRDRSFTVDRVLSW